MTTVTAQPALGWRGLLLVIPVALLQSFGLGARQASVLVLTPLVAFALPVVTMIAFWCEDWPGTRLPRSWSGWADTILIAIVAVLLTGAGQAIAWHLDVRGIFDPTPGLGHAATYPATLPPSGAVFVVILQVTLVCERWPLQRLPRIPAGLVALTISWAAALALYFVLVGVSPPRDSGLTVRDGPVAGRDLGAALVSIGAWQVLLFVVWRGWPFSAIDARWLRLGVANVVVIGGGLLTAVLAHDVGGVRSARIVSASGSFVAAGPIAGMLFEGWLAPHLSAPGERLATLTGSIVLAAVLAVALTTYANGRHFMRATPDDWVAHAVLNALAVSVILHVGVGRRWPFQRTQA